MLTLGGRLKIREKLSARLGDVFSYLYLASTVLKHYEDQGRQPQDLPLVEWAVRSLLYEAQEQLHKFLQNFPNRPVAWLLRFLVFPRGRTYSAPSDRIGRGITDLMINPTKSRDRLCSQVYREAQPGNPLGMLQAALERAVVMEPLERRLRDAVRDGTITALSPAEQIEAAADAGVLSPAEARELTAYHESVAELIAVDDFDTSEIGRAQAATTAAKKKPAPTRKRAAKKAAANGSGKKVAKKKAAKKKASTKKAATSKRPRKKSTTTEAGQDAH